MSMNPEETEPAPNAEAEGDYFFMNDVDLSALSCPVEVEAEISAVMAMSPRSSTLPRPFHRAVVPEATAVPISVFRSVPVEPERAVSVIEEDLQETPNFHDWRTICPELSIFLENLDVIREEVSKVHATSWQAWPESLSYTVEKEDAINFDEFEAAMSDPLGNSGETGEPGHAEADAATTSGKKPTWTVLPFLYTFPAIDASKMTWVDSCTRLFPRTTALLRHVPNIRTALFSRLRPKTQLTGHTGWEDLANDVLRVHIPVVIPDRKSGICGLSCNGDVQHHCPHSIMVFDDSKFHYAFNFSNEDRIVLIIDVLRPPGMPRGRLACALCFILSELHSLLSLFVNCRHCRNLQRGTHK
jgi:hypothetical protein